MALPVEQITWIRAGLDSTLYKIGADQMVVSSKQIEAATETAAGSQTKLVRSLLDSGREFQRLRTQTDPAYKALLEYNKALDASNRAFAAGRVDRETANSTLAATAKRLGFVSDAAVELARRTEQATRALQAMSAAQAAINGRLGIQAPPSEGDHAKRAADLQAYVVALDRERAALNPLFAAQQAAEQQIIRISIAEKSGAISTAEATKAYVANGFALQKATAAQDAYLRSLSDTDRQQQASQAAYNAWTLRSGPPAPPGGPPVANPAFGAPAGNPLYGSEYAKRQADLEAYVASLDDLRARFNPLFAAQRRYEDQILAIADAEKKGAIGTLEASNAYRENAAQLAKVTAAQDAYLASLSNAARQETQAQAAYNARSGVGPRANNPIELKNRALGLFKTEAEADAAVRDFKPSDGNPLYGAELRARQEQFQAALNARDQQRARHDSLFANSKLHEAEVSEIDELGLSPDRAEFLKSESAKRHLAGPPPPKPPKEDDADTRRARLDSLFANSKRYEAELREIDDLEKTTGLSAARAQQLRDDSAERNLASVQKVTKATKKGMEEAGYYTAGATREIIVLGHEMLVGNFSRIPGSLLVLVERLGSLEKVGKAVWAGISSGIGHAVAAFVVAATALTILGIRAEETNRRLNGVQNTLRGSRDDYMAAGAAAEEAAKLIARTTSISTQDAREATLAIQNVSGHVFQGGVDGMKELTLVGQNMSLVLGGTVPENVKKLVEAMETPSKAAEALVGHLKGFTGTFIQQLKDLEAGGHYVEAFRLEYERIKEATAGANEKLSDLQKSLIALVKELTTAGQSGKSFAQEIGEVVTAAAKDAVDAITAVIHAIKEARLATQEHGQQVPTPMMAINPLGALGFHPYDWLKQWLTSPGPPQQGVLNNDDAVGMFQLRRPAAADVGLRPEQRFDYAQNIHGGVQYFRQLYEQSGGDLDKATRAYNRGFDGATRGEGADYLEQVKRQDIARVPTQARDDISDAFGQIFSEYARTALGPELRKRVLQIALQESGAEHFGATTTTRLTPGEGARTGHGQVSDQLVPQIDPNKLLDDSQRTYLQLRLVERQRFDNLQQQNQQRLTIDLLQTRQGFQGGLSKEDQEHLDQAEKSLIRLKGLYNDILTPQEQSVRTSEDALRPLQAEEGAARELANIREKYFQMERSQGQGDSAAMTRELAAAQQALSRQFDLTTGAMQRQIAANDRLVAATEKGGLAAKYAANLEQAREEAAKTAPRGTPEYDRQVETRRRTLDAGTLTQSNLQAAGDVNRFGNENEMLEAEARLLRATAEERNRDLAVLQERIALGVKYGDQLTSEQEKALQAAAANANYRTAIDQYKSSMGEVEQFGTHAFESIGQAMSDSFTNAGNAAQIFRDMFSSLVKDIIKEFFKLAIINPALNQLFPGTNRPTLDSIGGALQNGPPKPQDGSGSNGGTLGGQALMQASQYLKGTESRERSSGATPVTVVNPDGSTNSSGLDSNGYPVNSGGSSGGGLGGNPFSYSGGGVMGWMIDKIGGEGFYKNGGLIGQWMKGSGSGGAVDTGTWDTGAASTAAASASGSGSGGGGLFGGLFGGGGGAGAGAAGVEAGTWDVPVASAAVEAWHTGGLIGVDTPIDHRTVSAAMMFSAPRFHSGLGNDEFAAILQRGERVVTANQNQQMEKVVRNAADGGSRGGHHSGGNVVFNIQTPNADSFRSSQPQIQARAASVMTRTQTRNRM